MSLIPWACHDHFSRSGYLNPWRLDREDFWCPWTRDNRNFLCFPEQFEHLLSVQRDMQSNIKEDKYEVNVDVQQFAPEDITVKSFGDNIIVVEGKHEERPDGHGYIARHFVRRYELPEKHNANDAISNLSSDGVLTITVPKLKEKPIETNVKTIPIQRKKEGFLTKLKHKLLG